MHNRDEFGVVSQNTSPGENSDFFEPLSRFMIDGLRAYC